MKPYYIEAPFVSPSLGLGCTIDFIGEVISGGKPKDMILDWKTGKNIVESHKVQLAIYMAILYDYTGVLIEDLAVVQIPQDGAKAKVEVVEDPWMKLYAGLLTYERWKIDRQSTLMWVRAPAQVLQARSKLRGKKRRAFDESEWRSWFAWPWLKSDSLEWWKETYEKAKGVKHELGSIKTGETVAKRIESFHTSQGR